MILSKINTESDKWEITETYRWSKVDSILLKKKNPLNRYKDLIVLSGDYDFFIPFFSVPLLWGSKGEVKIKITLLDRLRLGLFARKHIIQKNFSRKQKEEFEFKTALEL